MQGLWKTSCAVAALAILVVCSTSASASPIQAYLDEMVIGGPSIDIGEDVSGKAFPDPYLGPVAPLVGPISAGLVSGQFDLQCDTPSDPLACVDAAYFDGNREIRWGVLDVTGGLFGASFLTNGSGQNFFSSTAGLNGWLGSTGPGTGGVDQRLTQIAFNLEDSDTGFGGISLNPGRSYILFAVTGTLGFLTTDSIPSTTLLIGERNAVYIDGTGDEDGDGSAGNDPFETDPEFQLGSNDISGLFDDGVNYFGEQLITSRVIPIVPEPATLSLLAGAMLLAARRRSRA